MKPPVRILAVLVVLALAWSAVAVAFSRALSASWAETAPCPSRSSAV